MPNEKSGDHSDSPLETGVVASAKMQRIHTKIFPADTRTVSSVAVGSTNLQQIPTKIFPDMVAGVCSSVDQGRTGDNERTNARTHISAPAVHVPGEKRIPVSHAPTEHVSGEKRTGTTLESGGLETSVDKGDDKDSADAISSMPMASTTDETVPDKDSINAISPMGSPRSMIMKRVLRRAMRAARTTDDVTADTRQNRHSARIQRGTETSQPQILGFTTASPHVEDIQNECHDAFKKQAALAWRRIQCEAACRRMIKRRVKELAIMNNGLDLKREAMRLDVAKMLADSSKERVRLEEELWAAIGKSKLQTVDARRLWAKTTAPTLTQRSNAYAATTPDEGGTERIPASGNSRAQRLEPWHHVKRGTGARLKPRPSANLADHNSFALLEERDEEPQPFMAAVMTLGSDESDQNGTADVPTRDDLVIGNSITVDTDSGVDDFERVLEEHHLHMVRDKLRMMAAFAVELRDVSESKGTDTLNPTHQPRGVSKDD